MDYLLHVYEIIGSWIRKEAVITGFVVESLVDTD